MNEFRVKLKLNFRLIIYYVKKIELYEEANAVSFCREA